MRTLMAGLMAGLMALLMVLPAQAKPPKAAQFNKPPKAVEFYSTDAVLRWVNAYRAKPDPAAVPAVMRALSRLGGLQDTERAGVYVGFLAGVIGANPAIADDIIDKTLALPREDRWIVVRAIAYSGRADWQDLLRQYADRLPERRAMIDKYLAGKSPTLDQLVIAPSPGAFERLREHVRIDAVWGKRERKAQLEPSADVLDILWGYYFATGSYGPIMRIVAMLPWSADDDDVERLTLGSMAKYTLASNAMRDAELLMLLKGTSKARNQPKATVAALNEVTEAAETVELARIRKQALAAVDELRRKGPAYRRSASWWGFVTQSAVAGGCIAAAATGHVEFGLPCVIGGATVSGVTNYIASQP
jgi:hypothetical protein